MIYYLGSLAPPPAYHLNKGGKTRAVRRGIHNFWSAGLLLSSRKALNLLFASVLV